MKRQLLICVLVGFSCGDESDNNLSPEVPCGESKACPSDMSCRDGTCVDKQSLDAGKSCTAQDQCQVGLICHDGMCVAGCLDIYHLATCEDDTWCKPVAELVVDTNSGERQAGACSPSECDPQIPNTCQGGDTCVGITPTIGACVPHCAYGFYGGAYQDYCVDDQGVDHSCELLGIYYAPVCLPSGELTVGEPGCDAILRPCVPGAVCYNVVCRALCTPGQADPCPVGESCVAPGDRADVSFCRAD